MDKKEEVLTSHEVRLERWKGGGNQIPRQVSMESPGCFKGSLNGAVNSIRRSTRLKYIWQ